MITSRMREELWSKVIGPRRRKALVERLFQICLHGGQQSVPALRLMFEHVFCKPRQKAELDVPDFGEVITQEMRERLFARLLDRIREQDAKNQEIIEAEAREKAARSGDNGN